MKVLGGRGVRLNKEGRPVLLEADIEHTCTQILELDGWRALKTDPVSRREWGKGFGEKGMADVLYIRYDRSYPSRGDAEVMWIEWKCLRDGHATKAAPHQINWHATERARGAFTAVAGIDFEANIEGFQAWYLASGLNRRLVSV
jgi:hypothetical protein